MSKDTWLTAREALEWGFVDEITDDADDKEPLTDSAAAAMSSAGMPLPPGYKGRKGSMLNRFFDFLRSFNYQDSEVKPADGGQSSVEGPEISNDMNTDPNKPQQEPVSSAPAPEPLPAQQPAAPDHSAQSDKDAEIESLKSQLAERDRTISELRKQPAAPTSAVVDSKKEESDPYAPLSEAECIAASKAFLEKFS